MAGRWPHEQTERLRKRTRQLSLANALGARLAGMTDPQAIFEATVEELHRAFEYFLCAVIRIRDDDYVDARRARRRLRGAGREHWAQPRNAGLIGRCLRERRPVIGRRAEATDPSGARDAGRALRAGRAAVGGGRAVGRDQRRGDAPRRLRRGRRAAGADGRRPGRLGAALGHALRAARPRLRGHRRGAGGGARGQGLLHRQPLALGGGRARGRPPAGHGGGGAADAPLRGDLPRHRQDRGARGDPEQARPAHARSGEIERHTEVGERILSPSSSSATCCRWCATSTSAGTAWATPTG